MLLLLGDSAESDVCRCHRDYGFGDIIDDVTQRHDISINTAVAVFWLMHVVVVNSLWRLRIDSFCSGVLGTHALLITTIEDTMYISYSDIFTKNKQREPFCK